jgi:hypothetical protein
MQKATPFDGILEQSRDLIAKRLSLAIAGMLDKADEALSAYISETQSREEHELYQKTKDVTVAQRETIEKQFAARYLGDFRQCSNRARKIGGAFGDIDYSLGSLTLVSDNDLDETLKFNDMAAKLRVFCDEELMALDQRVGVLFGDANLQTDDNPFSPQVICDAYKHACRRADEDVRVRRILLRLFDDHVLDDIRSVYKAVNAFLVQNSILPKIRYGVSRKGKEKEPAPGASAGAGTPAGAPATDMSASTAPDFFAMLQKLVASNVNATAQPGVGGGTGAAADAQTGAGSDTPLLQGAELLNSLTRMQISDAIAVSAGNLAGSVGVPATANVLHELKGSSVGAGMGQVDLMTLDIVAMLFDQLFDDPNIPNGVKGIIGRMQIPMLKVAIADKTFFSKKTHPARQLLDTLGEIALRLPADFDTSNPLFARLESVLQEIVDRFQDNFEIFESVRERLQDLVVEEDQRVGRENQVVLKRVEETENLALAKNVAQEAVKVRVQAHNLPGPVLEFLVQQWLKLLLLLHVKEGDESPAWKEALESMDLLIWSVEPKNTIEERRKLATAVPGLIRKLAAGLKTAGIEDDVRVQFFSSLMEYHTQAISAPVQGKPDPASPAQAAPNQAERTNAVRQQTAPGGVSKAADSGTPDFSPTITVKNPFGGGEVSVDSLDFTAAKADGARAERDAAIADLLDNLKMGTWVEFREAEDRAAGQPVRLIFVSPRKTRYLFAVDLAGKEIIQCTRVEITRRFRIGEAVVMDGPPEDSLFDRIMNKVVGKLSAPGAPH